MDEKFSTATPAPARTTGSDPDRTSPPGHERLLLRFVLGVAELTGERVGAVLSACAAIAPPATPEQPAPGTPVNLRDAALGALSDAGGAVSRTPAWARARWRRMAASARRRAAPLDRVGALVGRLPGVPRATDRLRAWRDRSQEQLARWAELGRRERAQSRLLAFDALTVLRENMFARVAESPDVRGAIREQSQGMAVTAVGELRERSARADNLAERTVRRLFGAGR